MKFDDYQIRALRSWAPNPDQRDRVLNACLGLAGEVGECVEPLKKHYFHGKSLDVQDLKRELGDVLYYLTALANEFGFSLTDIAVENLAKVETRYPNGHPIVRQQGVDL